jgi:tRNA pseudouridine55 synthase
MDGVLVIDKPSGPTSHDIVARVRRAIGERRIGHTGTLDPLATGVLPLVVGRATRLAQFLSASSKTYDATVRLGLVTDTYDVAGRVVDEHDVPAEVLDRAHIERTLARFRGEYAQTPPPFSAKKVDGVRAYQRARRDQAVTLDPVLVTVEDLTLLGVDADSFRLRLTVSAGFYVRVLAHDLGAVLGVGGCLAALRRLRSGDFGLEDAVSLTALEQDPTAHGVHLRPLSTLLPSLPAASLTADGCRRALHGAALRAEDTMAGFDQLTRTESPLVRLVDESGGLRAIARLTANTLHPVVVLG